MTLQSIKTELGELRALLGGLVGKASTDQTTAFESRMSKAELTLKEFETKAAELAIAAKLETDALNAKIAKLTESLAAQEKSAKEAADKLATETARTDTTLSAMGVDPKTIPAGAPSPSTQKNVTGLKALKEYDAIKDPVAKTEFYRKNKAEIDASFKSIEGRITI